MEQFYFHTEKMTIGYDNKPLIREISMGIQKGEIVTIIGPNGSGKSTLLKSIIKELKILGGTSYLESKDLTTVSEKELAKKMSILMTERAKPELMTCFDVVATGRYPYTNSLGLLKDQDIAMINDALEMVHGEALADKDFNCISDGQKQRILLARCIAQNPEFIVLDEPTSFLDIKYKIELLEILKQLKEEKNVAILMSMHELDIAEYISDKVICVGKDGIDFIGKPSDVFTPEYIQKLFDIENELVLKIIKKERDTGDEENVLHKTILKNQKVLRFGITTGTCAAAATMAASIYLATGEIKEIINLTTPSGTKVEVPVYFEDTADDSCGNFYVIKDSGDDPDVTNGTKIYSKIKIYAPDINLDCSKKYFRNEDCPGVWLTGGKGIGIVTKEGLEQDVGYPAINKVPRQMIFDAVSEYLDLDSIGAQSVVVEISIPDGEELAKKTFNPMLGIEGGISVLGTSGILEPMSERAIIDTIETLIKQQAHYSKKALLVTPGHYGQGYVSEYLKLPLENSVKCSNYIGETIDLAVSYGFENMLLVGNIGKLVKLAAGIMNTHSKTADGRMDVFVTHLALCGGTREMAKKLYGCINTDTAFDLLNEWGLKDAVLESILNEIHTRVNRRGGDSLKIGVALFSEKYGYLGQTDYAEEILTLLKD